MNPNARAPDYLCHTLPPNAFNPVTKIDQLQLPSVTRFCESGLLRGNQGEAGAEAGVAVVKIEGVTAEREDGAETEKKNTGTGGTNRVGEFEGRGPSGGRLGKYCSSRVPCGC